MCLEFLKLQVVQFGLNVEMKENLSQIIKDRVQHVEVLGCPSVSDYKTLKIRHSHF